MNDGTRFIPFAVFQVYNANENVNLCQHISKEIRDSLKTWRQLIRWVDHSRGKGRLPGCRREIYSLPLPALLTSRLKCHELTIVEAINLSQMLYL